MPASATPLDPRIGQLNGGKFYCFPNGYGQPELIGSREEIEVALGLRRRVAASKPKPSRRYLVTVTPVLHYYIGAWQSGEYTVEVDATSRSEAIAIVRRQRNENEGRHRVRANFSAVLAKP